MIGWDHRIREAGTLLQPGIVNPAQNAQRLQVGRVVDVVDDALVQV